MTEGAQVRENQRLGRSHLGGEAAEWDHAHLFPGEATFRYPEGFKMAAEVLVDYVYETQDFSWRGDSLAYPIVYLLRHYLELKLKNVLSVAGIPFKPTHHLLDLWKKLRADAAVWFPDESVEYPAELSGLELREHEGLITAAEAEEILHELHDFDPSGEGFRYATKKDGSRSLPESLKTIDLKRWLGRVLSVGTLLDGVETAICESSELRQELEAHYRDE